VDTRFSACVESDPSSLIRQLSLFESSKPGSFRVYVSNAQGKAVCLTKELLLDSVQKELNAQLRNN